MEEIRKLLSSEFNLYDIVSIEKDDIGNTAAEVYIITTANGKVVLKSQKRSDKRALFNLSNKLKWLKGKLPVPELLDYREVCEKEYLLTRYIEGEPSFIYGQNGGDDVGTILGQSLKIIHDQNIEKCPFEFDLDKEVQSFIDSIKNSVVKQEMLEEFFPNCSKEEIVLKVESLVPERWDLVLSHGDYCLPNILIKDNKLSGFIDLGDAGIIDRNFDIYYGLWSLKYNGLGEYCEQFLDVYDREKISFGTIKLIELLDSIMWE